MQLSFLVAKALLEGDFASYFANIPSADVEPEPIVLRDGPRGDPRRLRQRRGEEAAPGVLLLDRPGTRERDALMRSRLRWLGEQVGWFLGIAGCLLLLVALLPLVPILELYDDVRRAYEDK